MNYDAALDNSSLSQLMVNLISIIVGKGKPYPIKQVDQ
jgi:hypothetical protein